MDVTVELKGLKQFDARMAELDALVAEKLMRRVLRRVAKPLTDRARSNAVSVGRSGALAKSIATVTKRSTGRQVAVVATTSKARDKVAVTMHNQAYSRRRKGIFYGWMLERGHRTRPGKAGSGGMVQGRPWFRPAVAATQPAFASTFVREMNKALRRMEQRTGLTPQPDVLVPE